MVRIEQITDLSEKLSERVVRDYLAMGAEVSRVRQPDGRWQVTARLSEELVRKFVA